MCLPYAITKIVLAFLRLRFVGEMDTLVGTMIATQRQNCGRGPVDRAVLGGCSRSGRASPGRNTEAGTCRMGRAMGW